MKLKNKIINRPYQLLYSLIILITLTTITTSCKSSKETTEGSEAMKIRSEQELLSAITSNTIQYNTISASLKTNIKMGKNDRRVSSSLKLIKDDRLQLSFQFLGSELFKIVVSQDSFIMVDRMNKMYVEEAIEDIRKATNFDFGYHNLQSLFTNQIFLPGKESITNTDFSLFSVAQSKYEAQIKSDIRQNVFYIFTCDYTDKIKQTEITGKNGKQGLVWTYNQFSETSDKQVFPMEMQMNLALPKDENLNMEFSFSKIDINKDVNIDSNIPKKYKRITLEQAMTIFKTLS